ncbi:MAG: aldehyde dehydrogenase family protein [Chloroflexota bacterium]|nr:MAG: aldehyde dehydrogenase family protein [Chloroflexota bacterium]
MEEARQLRFTNPATGEQFGQIPVATASEAQQALCDMRVAFETWSQKPVRERARILGELQKVMIDASDEISLVINQDTGKSRQDGLIELFMTLDLLQLYRKHGPKWLARRRVPRGLFLFKECFVEQRPFGTVLVIAPWNYPFFLSMPPVLAALLAGNTVVLKPSEVTAATGALMERLFQRVPELASYVRVVHGDSEVGAALVQAEPDFIFLTGSTKTGKLVAKAAGEKLIPISCELGGKDAVIVLADADVKKAAHWITWGAFYNTGQTCMAVERVYVTEPVYDAFVREAVRVARKLKVGYSYEKKSPYYLGPMTDPRQLQIVNEHIEDALKKGARVLLQGKHHGMFIEPTVMVDVDHSMLLMQEETFGPILPIVRVKDEEEAVRLANDSKFGLGASVWSRSRAHAERVASQLNVGTLLINDVIAQIAVPALPFGGTKHSGSGRIHGREGLLQFTQTRALAISTPPNPLDLATHLRRPGTYGLGETLMKLVFGVTPKQRMEPRAEGV